MTCTLFTVPKPFVGQAELLQRNAIATWLELSDVRVLLLGDDLGVSDAAHHLGVAHEPCMARTASGAPDLADVFKRAEQFAPGDELVFVNTDILLPENFVRVVREVRETLPAAVCVGECLNVDVAERVARWEQSLAARGRLRGPGGIDYLAFTRGSFPSIPTFALGRAYFDNWLLWDARRRGLPVVDVGAVARALHQNHDYGHLPRGRRDAYEGPDAERNLSLAGGRLHLFNIDDATHRLLPTGLERNRVAPLRANPAVRGLALSAGALRRRVAERARR